MNNKFDELTKSMAQSVTRRGALKKFGLGMAGLALACFGLANKAGAIPSCAACKRSCKAAGYSEQQCKVLCAPFCVRMG